MSLDIASAGVTGVSTAQEDSRESAAKLLSTMTSKKSEGSRLSWNSVDNERKILPRLQPV